VTGTVTATHTFKVTNFSLLDGMGIGKHVDSSTFSAGDHDWNIRVYPDGCKEEGKAVYMSVVLNLMRGAVGVRVKFSMSLLDKHGHVSKVREDTHTFEWANGFWGWGQYMEKSKLKPLLHLNNDRFTIRCDLTVIQDSLTEAVASTNVVVPQSNLQQHFERMLKDGRATDVTFSVAGELFHAHRCVLAARSPVFEAELFGPVKEQATQPIRIDDMEPAI
jgi:speckle-type POZ protein